MSYSRLLFACTLMLCVAGATLVEAGVIISAGTTGGSPITFSNQLGNPVTSDPNPITVQVGSSTAGVILDGNGANVDHTDAANWFQFSIVPQAGFGLSVIDFEVDTTHPSGGGPQHVIGTLTLTVTDALGALYNSTFDLENKSNPFSAFLDLPSAALMTNVSGVASFQNTTDHIHRLHHISIVSAPLRDATTVPEPASIAVWCVGSLGLALVARRRARRLPVA